MGIVYDTSHRNSVEDKLSKKTICLFGAIAVSPLKVEKPTYGTDLYHRANFHANRRQISVRGQKIHIFLIMGATVRCYTFLESSRRANVMPLFTSKAATYRLGNIRSQNLGFWGPLGVPSRAKNLTGTHVYHHAQFHADRWHLRRYICSRTHRYKDRIFTADLVYDKTHTSVAFVDNKLYNNQKTST